MIPSTLLIVSTLLISLAVTVSKRLVRVSDPLDIGGPWPFTNPVDVNLLHTPSDDVPTVDTDIPGDPLGPEDFNRPIIEEDQSSSYAGQRRDPIEMAGLFQGDILLTSRDDINVLSLRSSSSGKLRNAIIDLKRRWNNGVIPYVISKSYDLDERSIVAAAFKEFHNSTCIRFIPRSSEADYIHILKGDGCSSSVGRVGGAQAVSLGAGCLVVGVVMHELMHATGFWHEQSRNDRDEYIKILWDNIQDGMEYNFQKYNWSEIQSLGVNYDPRSIMHYGPYAFAKDRQKPTIIPLSTDPIGQREGFSENDMEKIRKLYECEGSTFVNTIVMPESVTADSCDDYSKNCGIWSKSGECDKNPLWMRSNCRKSCLECGRECGNDHKNCVKWAKEKECTINPPYMLLYCKMACGLCPAENEVNSECTDKNKHCSVWASNGQCRVNPRYMAQFCKKSCSQC